MSALWREAPEERALGALRLHRDSMTRPDMAAIAEAHGLTPGTVQDMWERLLSGKKDAFRPPGGVLPQPTPRPAVALPIAPKEPPVATPTPEPWRAGIDHPSKVIARKAAKALALIAEVEAELAAEAERDRLRAQEAALLARIAAVREALHGPDRVAACPECGRAFGGPRPLSVHRSKSHGVRSPKPSRQAVAG